MRINEDMVSARLEGLRQEEMESKLRILGHLIMHTRQLDIIMSHTVMVERYRAKMRENIAARADMAPDEQISANISQRFIH